MVLTLHTFSGAPRGWRVLLGLTFKQLEWNTHLIRHSDGEHRSPEFLALNQRGTVPVLETGGPVVRDSIAILAWLDRRYPDKLLFGTTADQAALVWQITMESCDYLREAARRLLIPVFGGDDALPQDSSAQFAELKSAADAMHKECRYLESLLENRRFLAGDTPSAADAVAFPEIRLIQRAVETKHELMSALGFSYPPDLYPKVADWKSRVGEIPGVDKTLPPHWRPVA